MKFPIFLENNPVMFQISNEISKKLRIWGTWLKVRAKTSFSVLHKFTRISGNKPVWKDLLETWSHSWLKKTVRLFEKNMKMSLDAVFFMFFYASGLHNPEEWWTCGLLVSPVYGLQGFWYLLAGHLQSMLHTLLDIAQWLSWPLSFLSFPPWLPCSPFLSQSLSISPSPLFRL